MKIVLDKADSVCYHTCMAQIRNTNCVGCGKDLRVSIWSDRSVGIPFDFDVLEGSTCTCDWDDDSIVDKIYADVNDKFYGEVW